MVKTWGIKNEGCLISGIELPQILTASHIIPWRECIDEKAHMRLDGANGILLCANYDRLFDRYLISFKKNGNSCSIQISKSLSKSIKLQLSLSTDLELVPNLMSDDDRLRFFSYIEQHYNKFVELEMTKNVSR